MVHKLHNNVLCSKTSRNCSTIWIVANEFPNIITSYCLNFFVSACCQSNKKLSAVIRWEVHRISKQGFLVRTLLCVGILSKKENAISYLHDKKVPIWTFKLLCVFFEELLCVKEAPFEATRFHFRKVHIPSAHFFEVGMKKLV
jgi:hypothetical protein